MKKIIPLVLLAALGFGGWKYYTSSEPENEDDVLTLYGNVDIRDVLLSFRIPGRIAKVRMEEGDRIQKGDVVATLDTDTYEENLALAMAHLAEANAAFDNAERNYQRRKKLVETGAVSQRLYDEALAQHDQASARVQTAKVQLDQAQTALQDTRLQAPDAGIILTRIREPGSVVAPGQPVYSLAIDNPVWVRTYIAEPDLGRIYPGQPAKIYTDTQPDKPYQGTVGFISPQAEFTPKNVETTQLRTDLVYRLRIIVQDSGGGLRQGMPVTVRIDTVAHPSNNSTRTGNEN